MCIDKFQYSVMSAIIGRIQQDGKRRITRSSVWMSWKRHHRGGSLSVKT